MQHNISDFKTFHKHKRYSAIPFDEFVNLVENVKNNSVHNDAFDMGLRDFYYYRRCKAKAVERVFNPESNCYENIAVPLNEEQKFNYYLGYYYQKFIYGFRRDILNNN